MLRLELSKKSPTKTIDLPKKYFIKEQKPTNNRNVSTDTLGEMSNFTNDPISSTPPDGYFMHNLRVRMEKEKESE